MALRAMWQGWGRLPTWGLALLVAAGVLIAACGASLVADFDADGAGTWRELALGTDPLWPDSDGDGLADGDEAAAGTDPLRRDSDGDGLRDGAEWTRHADPLARDTDRDGIPDGDEADEDCDGDGIPAIASSDDDSDGLPDASEPLAARCDPDSDDDGLLDGDEANLLCLFRADCDEDGLTDAAERAAGYDPLDPDTFSTGFPDAVGLAFQRQGQTPTADADGDGIPDGWEQPGGLIDWGPFAPRAGVRDLFIEYVRVVGPDSGRYVGLNFTPAYEAVDAMFGAEGIDIQWVETIVVRDREARPDFLTPADIDYFRSVLENSTQSTNPYVTSVILNPQQVQTHPGFVLGAAFLRNMVATVDYGAHTEVAFNANGGSITIRPIVESHIQSGRPELIRAYGFDSGGVAANGEVFMRRDFDADLGQGFKVSWRPEWFRTAPLYEADDGQTLQLVNAGATILTAELASTIAHELGHTLSLCHPHEPDCAAWYGGLSEAQIRSSTMSYTAPTGALSFLPVEWQALTSHLRCPPQATAALVAQGASASDILAAKYDAAFTRAVQQRACEELAPLAREFDPRPDATHWQPPPLSLHAGQDGAGALRLFSVVSVAAAVGAAVLAIAVRRH